MRADLIEAGQLSAILAERIEAVADRLDIDVRRRSPRTLYCISPWDKHPGAKLEIGLSPIAGKWNDWGSGKYGDALDLVACVLGHGDKDRKAAYAWSLEFLGLKSADPARWQAIAEDAAKRQAERQARAARELSAARRTAQARWLGARALQPGDHGWIYLQERRADIGELPRRPRAIRYAEAEPWYGEDREVAHIGPCLLSAMTLHNGAFGSLHRVWINPERPGEKADLKPPRKMWPSSEGAAIRLWRGGSGLSEAEAAKKKIREPVVVCEGVEDGLSIALITPELRIVAAGSLAGLGSYVPPACASRLIIAADNDWGKPQAQAQLDRACERLAGEFGMRLFIARSPVGKDFNDLLRGE